MRGHRLSLFSCFFLLLEIKNLFNFSLKPGAPSELTKAQDLDRGPLEVAIASKQSSYLRLGIPKFACVGSTSL